jgi:hypothetical protein
LCSKCRSGLTPAFAGILSVITPLRAPTCAGMTRPLVQNAAKDMVRYALMWPESAAFRVAVDGRFDCLLLAGTTICRCSSRSEALIMASKSLGTCRSTQQAASDRELASMRLYVYNACGQPTKRVALDHMSA